MLRGKLSTLDLIETRLWQQCKNIYLKTENTKREELYKFDS